MNCKVETQDNRKLKNKEVGRYEQEWANMGRIGQIWAGVGRYVQEWADMGRSGQIWAKNEGVRKLR